MKMLLDQPTHICPYSYIDHGTLNPSEFQPCTVLRDKPGNSPFRKAEFSLLIWLYCPSPKLMASCFLSFFFPQVTVLKLTKYFFQVCEVYKLHRETFYLAQDFFDRYMATQQNIVKTLLQLIGISSLFIAAKLEVNYFQIFVM